MPEFITAEKHGIEVPQTDTYVCTNCEKRVVFAQGSIFSCCKCNGEGQWVKLDVFESATS